jgi:3-dehydroquinate synthase
MYLEAKLSHQLGLIGKTEVLRIRALIASYDLPSEMPGEIEIRDLFETMQIDKKTVAGKMHFVLPEKVGSVRIHSEISAEDIKKLLG